MGSGPNEKGRTSGRKLAPLCPISLPPATPSVFRYFRGQPAALLGDAPAAARTTNRRFLCCCGLNISLSNALRNNGETCIRKPQFACLMRVEEESFQ
jgi:hypothetical protein